MAFENYQIWSWIIYLLSALVVMLVTLRITRRWRVTLRGFVVTTATVLFVMPWYGQGSGGPMAPAVIITFFEAFDGKNGQSWMRAGLPLLGALAVGYLLLALYLGFVRSRNQAAAEAAENDAGTPDAS